MASDTENIIYKTKDEYGDIHVTENSAIRALYFGDDKTQSAMFVSEPSVLLLNCAQAMASVLMFCYPPKRILIVGLGGGSLVHFLLKSCSNSIIDVVELRKSVINIARDYFFLPDNLARVSIIHDDAKSYVETLARKKSGIYDIILIDAFSQWGVAEINQDMPFILGCQSLLSENGVISFNLWNRKEDCYEANYRCLAPLFNENLLELSLAKQDSNVLLFGFKNEYHIKNIRVAEMRAAKLKLDWGIDFSRYMKLIQIQNLSLLKKIKKHFSITL